MTFIASVVAKKGVAIIADSLVTSQMPILHLNEFNNYLEDQSETEKGKNLVDISAVNRLFNYETVFTDDFEEKLFKLNDYTAVTTAGAARINGINIAGLIERFRGQQSDIDDLGIPIEHKLEQFSAFLNEQVRGHLNNNKSLDCCAFIVTFHERHTYKTYIFRLVIEEVDNSSLVQEGYNYVTLTKVDDSIKVVCDGQNKISDKVLYGFSRELFDVFLSFAQILLRVLRIPDHPIPADFAEQVLHDSSFKKIFSEEIELLNLTDLSIQQAVDLASLLMRLEVDFQKYTKKIPTVGGIIRLAVIDESGFRFISGHKIKSPKHINS
jgi:hypothetical protein